MGAQVFSAVLPSADISAVDTQVIYCVAEDAEAAADMATVHLATRFRTGVVNRDFDILTIAVHVEAITADERAALADAASTGAGTPTDEHVAAFEAAIRARLEPLRPLGTLFTRTEANG